MIYVMDGFNIIDSIETKRSVIWNVQYNGLNEFELIVAGTDENIEKLAVGRYLVRDIDVIDNNEYRNVMIITTNRLTFDTDTGWILTVTGNGLKALLKRRVIWTQTNLDGTVENGIRTLITENAINPSDTARMIPNMVLDSASGLTDEFEAQCFGENLAEWIQQTCETYNYGWDIYISESKYHIKIYKGTDRSGTVIFSRNYDNLISGDYEYNKDEYKNAAIVGGEGEGKEQRRVTIGTATGLDRYETYVDGSGVSSDGEIITLETYLNMLKEYGKNEIAQTAITQTFTGEVVANGMYKLNEDYFLGDVVHIENERGIEANSRISEIIYSEDENGVVVSPTFNDWEVE